MAIDQIKNSRCVTKTPLDVNRDDINGKDESYSSAAVSGVEDEDLDCEEMAGINADGVVGQKALMSKMLIVDPVYDMGLENTSIDENELNPLIIY
ncbi:hypothetical protein NDU88_010810 [Pleurodeles waltl]|uniref:Uncharacterized protein n=1 Tax=Pleurodeles waltl TaxID=8319 RepID=A0AAV7S026_PLEWA|nr:hypothetical protein NDU88_010810 [Pleurodeles waltl]